jgi:hypothetical protein
VPPKHLSDGAKTVWKEVTELAPWLRRPDSQALEIYAGLLASFREDQSRMGGRQLALLTQLQRALGLQWAARQSVQRDPSPKPYDPAEAFFRPLQGQV